MAPILVMLLLGGALEGTTETESPKLVFVDASSVCVPDAAGGTCGESWTSAFSSIQDAIDSARGPTWIFVRRGQYQPIRLKNGVTVIGGFSGTESLPSQADPNTNTTTIDGGGSTRAITSIANDQSAVLRGVYVRNGVSSERLGAAVGGGGAYFHDSDAILAEVVFEHNHAAYAGGAIAVDGGAPTFVGCTFRNNGDRELSGHGDTIGTLAGGAVFIHYGAPLFYRCLFAANAAKEGGAVVNTGGSPRFLNCTFASNHASLRSGGAVADHSGAVIENCIVWSNTASEGHQSIYMGTYASSSVEHSDIEGGWPGTGNLDADPRFMNLVGGEYRLAADSPCRGAGSNYQLPADQADLDYDGDRTETLDHFGMFASESGPNGATANGGILGAYRD